MSDVGFFFSYPLWHAGILIAELECRVESDREGRLAIAALDLGSDDGYVGLPPEDALFLAIEAWLGQKRPERLADIRRVACLEGASSDRILSCAV